jgi:hypothetical protein
MILTGIALNLPVDPAAPAQSRHSQREREQERGAQNPVAAFWAGRAFHAFYDAAIRSEEPKTGEKEPEISLSAISQMGADE